MKVFFFKYYFFFITFLLKYDWINLCWKQPRWNLHDDVIIGINDWKWVFAWRLNLSVSTQPLHVPRAERNYYWLWPNVSVLRVDQLLPKWRMLDVCAQSNEKVCQRRIQHYTHKLFLNQHASLQKCILLCTLTTEA